MNLYTVWVTETTKWEVEVEAPNVGAAMLLAEKKVNNFESANTQVQANAKVLHIEIEAEDAVHEKGVEGGAS